MKTTDRALWTAVILTLAPIASAAQDANVLLTEGLRAYQDLDFAAAVQLLRRSLDPADTGALTRPDRLRALMYLGAAHLFREDRDQAVVTFRHLLLADARYRPDSLVFPPKVTQVFGEVLQTTKAVALAAPPEVRFPAGEQGFLVRAYATSRQTIEAGVASARGRAIATLFRGEISDSVTLSWNGLDSAGRAVPAGAYQLVIASSLVPGRVLRRVSLPLAVSIPSVDTVPWPPAPQAGRSGWDLRFLIPGAALGAALAVPAALGAGGAQGFRIAAGVSVTTAGIIAGRPRASAPDRQAEAEWRTGVRAARQENQHRRARPEMVIQSGKPEQREGAGQ